MARRRADRTILIVDDEPAIRRLLAAFLYQAGYSTGEADCAEDALQKLDRVTPDLILLDYILPDMDGVLLLQIIRSRPKLQYLPVIFVTGKVDIPSKQLALESGALDYIVKPFDPQDLIARITAHV